VKRECRTDVRHILPRLPERTTLGNTAIERHLRFARAWLAARLNGGRA
jgi:hypothetical protein